MTRFALAATPLSLIVLTVRLIMLLPPLLKIIVFIHISCVSYALYNNTNYRLCKREWQFFDN